MSIDSYLFETFIKKNIAKFTVWNKSSIVKIPSSSSNQVHQVCVVLVLHWKLYQFKDNSEYHTRTEKRLHIASTELCEMSTSFHIYFTHL